MSNDDRNAHTAPFGEEVVADVAAGTPFDVETAVALLDRAQAFLQSRVRDWLEPSHTLRVETERVVVYIGDPGVWKAVARRIAPEESDDAAALLSRVHAEHVARHSRDYQFEADLQATGLADREVVVVARPAPVTEAGTTDAHDSEPIEATWTITYADGTDPPRTFVAEGRATLETVRRGTLEVERSYTVVAADADPSVKLTLVENVRHRESGAEPAPGRGVVESYRTPPTPTDLRKTVRTHHVDSLPSDYDLVEVLAPICEACGTTTLPEEDVSVERRAPSPESDVELYLCEDCFAMATK